MTASFVRSPDATVNLYARPTMRTDDSLHAIDRQLYAELEHISSPSTSHFVLATDDEEDNPLGHDLTLG